MFGMLKYAECGLPRHLRQEWTGYICGVCSALRKNYGPLAGIATNYDAALLEALYVAQVEQESVKQKQACLLRGQRQVWTTDPTSPGARYSAGMALLIAATKIVDDLHDGEFKLRLLTSPIRRLVQGWQTAALATFAALGLNADSIVEQIERQQHIERQPEQPFEVYARPTELAVGAAFANTAALALRPDNGVALGMLGRAYGRIMFLLDSYRDYAADHRAGRFNPLSAASPAINDLAQVARLFQQAETALRDSFSSLTLQRPDLLDALLLHQLCRTGHRTLGSCQPTHVCRFEQSRSAMANRETSEMSLFRPPPGWLMPVPDDEPQQDGNLPTPEDQGNGDAAGRCCNCICDWMEQGCPGC